MKVAGSAPAEATRSPAASASSDPRPAAVPVLATGQDRCYDASGRAIPCPGSGQDGEFRLGLPWPAPRFSLEAETVRDRLTDLVWSRDANPAQFPLTWQEALYFTADLNREKYLGFADWRMPNRRELRSILSFQAKKPALPADHPFVNVFLGWYWTSTSAAINPAYAWYVHMEGARMFYGHKEEYSLLWPVRAGAPAPGAEQALPPRFRVEGETALDLRTGLTWLRNAEIAGRPLPWQEALQAVRRLNEQGAAGARSWRLPNINELESLVDCSRHSPALPADHPFPRVQEVYWSSTTSFFETDWAWTLYLHKGATGVGHKKSAAFHAWPVA